MRAGFHNVPASQGTAKHVKGEATGLTLKQDIDTLNINRRTLNVQLSCGIIITVILKKSSLFRFTKQKYAEIGFSFDPVCNLQIDLL